MLLNKKTQLGLLISENKGFQEQIFEKQTADIKNRKTEGLINENELDFGIKNLKELVLDEGNYKNENYLIKNTALHMAKKIKLDNTFDIKFLSNLPVKKATFLLGKELAFKYYKTKDNVYAAFYYFEPKTERLSWIFLRINLITGDILLPDAKGDVEITFSNELGLENADDSYEHSTFKLFLQLLIFVELSDLKIDILEPNRKIGQKRSGKYLNQSTQNISIVDSKWNIISIRKEEFIVNGFWRNQPYGKDNRFRKYIYIAPFKKKGYTRKRSNFNPNTEKYVGKNSEI